jgi:uncharacterized protein YcbK (DUF882 family)
MFARFSSFVGFGLAAALSLSVSSSGAELEHVVAKGHTLQAIANRYHVSVDSIVERNHLAKKSLQPGDVLVIPVSGSAGKKDGKTDIKADAHAGAGGAAAHDVKAGDKKDKASDRRANAKDGKDGKRAFVGKSPNPGTIKVHRLATNEDYSIRISTRGKTGPEAMKKFSYMMRFTNGVVHNIDGRLISLLGVVSDHFAGRKIEVISGYRPYTPKQYTKDSRHNHGKAVDFRVVGVPNEVVRDFCRTLRNTGCGYYPNSVFVHMDTREASAFWIDYSRPGEPPRYHSPNSDADESTSDVHGHGDADGEKTDDAKTPAGADAPKAPDAPSAPKAPDAPSAPKVEIPKPGAESPVP